MDSIISQHAESKAIKFQKEGERKGEREKDSRECLYKEEEEEDGEEEAAEKEPCWNIFPENNH